MRAKREINLALSHPGEQKQEVAALQKQHRPAGKKMAKDGDIGRCGDAMSDTKVYLLLDRQSTSGS